MTLLVIALYFLLLLFIFFYSLMQAHLVYKYVTHKKVDSVFTNSLEFPLVTVQLPVYNELYVIERLIDAVAAFDYPKEKFEVQVLDDSTDETTDIISAKVQYYCQQGYDVVHIRRKNRKGFKAGALDYGLQIAKGDFIAIFDADFVPAPDFLVQTVPYFSKPEVGVVQTRWGHLNKDYSLITKLQAFALDGHFIVEQSGRNFGKYFINFNGTAGIWRKSCIEDAGGWNADTLTEDLDLSYRAQMRKWEFKYLEDVVSPAELPPVMTAVKSQQYRWTKGAAETARKHLGSVWKTDMPLSTKLHASFHLLNSALFICIFFTAFLSVPFLIMKGSIIDEYRFLFNLASVFMVSLLILTALYWVSFKKNYKGRFVFFAFLRDFPLFLSVTMGLSLHNAIAVLEGYFDRKTPFVRTPKFNNLKKEDLKSNKYATKTINILTLVEGVLVFYFGFGIFQAFVLHDYGLLPFHALLTFGFATVFYYSVFHSIKNFQS
jgi:cellulose synthase/poly-beta-1,6-N-acetylglucosamine synthase-like glycosyltransferase